MACATSQLTELDPPPVICCALHSSRRLKRDGSACEPGFEHHDALAEIERQREALVQAGEVRRHFPAEAGHLAAEAVHLPAEAVHLPAEAGHLAAEAGHLAVEAGHLAAETGHLAAKGVYLAPHLRAERGNFTLDGLDLGCHQVLHRLLDGLVDVDGHGETLAVAPSGPQGYEYLTASRDAAAVAAARESGADHRNDGGNNVAQEALVQASTQGTHDAVLVGEEVALRHLNDLLAGGLRSAW